MPTILLTGTSRGIGRATAAALRARGAAVIGHSSRPSAASDTIAADFAEPPAPQVLWEEALERASGQIDVLINNAGIYAAAPLDTSDIAWLDAWEETMRINLTAAAQLSRFAVRHWLETGRPGRIVHVASRAGHRGDSPEHWHYAASKGGMLALHKTIARAYASRGILSFAINPGFTQTGMAEDYLASRGRDELPVDIPLGRMATPEEIARIAAFCALDAPPSLTGATLDANGASYVR
jgi:NAD(P)-dependent dehydrogenase (short-subunit alcohol dehydrogenase family)